MTCSLCPSLPFLAKLKAEQEEKELSLASKTPVFPMTGPQHYSNYGFDPQLDYFQVLEEARRHSNRETRSPDALHFSLQKPVLEEYDSRRGSKNRKRCSRWWRNALLFFKRKRGDVCSDGDRAGPAVPPTAGYSSVSYPSSPYSGGRTVAGPLYSTASGTWTPCRRSAGGGWGCRPGSGPLRFSEAGDVEVPYLCLSDAAATASCPAPAVPIYLVT